MTANSKFYALTPEEFLELNQLLKDAELRVYLYLVTNHPWNDRKVETDTAIIAEKLGLTRRTIQRAIRQLEELNLIEIELSRFKYCQSRRKVKNDTRIAKATHGSLERQMDRSGDTRIAETTDGSLERQVDRFEAAKPFSDKTSSSLQTINTYSDFKKTLSEDERENFLDFCKKKVKNLSQEVNDIEAWLAHPNKAGQNRWEVYYEKFKAAPTTSELKTYKGLTSQDIQKQAQQFREELKQMKNGTRKDSPSERDDSPEKEATPAQETPPEDKSKNVLTASDLDKVIADYERNGRGQLPKIKPPNNPHLCRRRR